MSGASVVQCEKKNTTPFNILINVTLHQKRKTKRMVGNGNLIKFEINPTQITSEVENLIY